MNYYIKQHVFTLVDSFDIYNEYGEPIYRCEGEFLRFLKHLHILDARNDEEVAYIEQKFQLILQGYDIYVHDSFQTEVQREFTFFHSRYILPDLGWRVEGDFLAHEFAVFDEDENVVFALHKEWMTWGDTYEIEINEAYDPILCIAIAITIDASNDAAHANNG